MITIESPIEFSPPDEPYGSFEEIPERLRTEQFFTDLIRKHPECFRLIPHDRVTLNICKGLLMTKPGYLRFFYATGCPDYERLAIFVARHPHNVRFINPLGVGESFCTQVERDIVHKFLITQKAFHPHLYTKAIITSYVRQGLPSALLMVRHLKSIDPANSRQLMDLVDDRDLLEMARLRTARILSLMGKEHLLIDKFRRNEWPLEPEYRPSSISHAFRLIANPPNAGVRSGYLLWLKTREIRSVLNVAHQVKAFRPLVMDCFTAHELKPYMREKKWLKAMCLEAEMGV
jgi:hypothetical protein